MNVKKKNFVFDCILILITGGLWNIWMQYRQIRDYNLLTNSDKYSFTKWFLLSLITFGIYHVIHEYRLTKDICIMNGLIENEVISIASAALSITGLWVLVDLYQQELINQKVENS